MFSKYKISFQMCTNVRISFVMKYLIYKLDNTRDQIIIHVLTLQIFDIKWNIHFLEICQIFQDGGSAPVNVNPGDGRWGRGWGFLHQDPALSTPWGFDIVKNQNDKFPTPSPLHLLP